MKKFFNNEKIFLWFNIICFAVGGTIPLVTISLYNYMSVDDFAKGVKFRSIYTNPSLLDAFVFAFEQIRTSWERWQGVYTVNFFSVFNPAFFMEELAFLTPIIMLIVLIISTSIFLGTMLRTINADRVHIAIIVTLFLFLQLQTMPSMVETIFWYSGAVAYTVSLAFFYIFFAMVIKRNNCKKSITIHDFGLILLAFLLGGTQFTIVLESLIIYFIYFVFTIKQYTFPKCAVLASLLLGGGLNIFAPGNLVRRDANGNGMGPIEAILESFKWAANASIEWISPMFIFVILLMIPIIWCIVRKTKNKKFRYPLLVVLFSFCVFASCYTPSLYGVGTAWAGRVQNQIQGFYYLIVLFDIFYIIGYIQDKFSNIESAANLLKDYRIAYQWIMVFLICIIWLGTPNKNTYNSISALRSLITGEAQTYYQENLQRLELYRNPDLKEIVVEPFSVYPKLLVYQDLGTDESDFYYWINLSVADYYGKKKIEMKE